MSDSLRSHGLQAAKLLCPWNSPDKNTGVGRHSLLQGVFLTQGLNSSLLYYRQSLYSLNHQGTATLFGKPSDPEDGELVPQGNILPGLGKSMLLLY